MALLLLLMLRVHNPMFGKTVEICMQKEMCE